MATKVYKSGYQVIVDEELKPYNKYTTAAFCSFGFDGDTCWIKDIADTEEYIYNDLCTNMANSSGSLVGGKSEVSDYLLTFIGDQSSNNSVDLNYYFLGSATSVSGAYSLRKITDIGTKSVELIRTDSQTTDVFLDDDNTVSISLSSIVSGGETLGEWIGSDSAYVKTWYDQGIHGNHCTQTPSLEPQLINNGVILTLNNNPSIEITSTRKFLSMPSPLYGYSENVDKTVVLLSNTNNNILRQRAVTLSAGSTSNLGLWYEAGAGVVSFTSTSYANRVETSTTTTSQNLVIGVSSGTEQALYANGVSGGTNSLGGTVSGTNNGGIGGYTGSANDPFDGNLQELILYNSNETLNIPDIESNINNFYSVY